MLPYLLCSALAAVAYYFGWGRGREYGYRERRSEESDRAFIAWERGLDEPVPRRPVFWRTRR